MVNDSYKLGLGDIVDWGVNQLRQIQENKRQAYEAKLDQELQNVYDYMREIEVTWRVVADMISEVEGYIDEIIEEYYNKLSKIAPNVIQQEAKEFEKFLNVFISDANKIRPKSIEAAQAAYDSGLRHIEYFKDAIAATIEVRMADLAAEQEGKSIITSKTKYYMGR